MDTLYMVYCMLDSLHQSYKNNFMCMQIHMFCLNTVAACVVWISYMYCVN